MRIARYRLEPPPIDPPVPLVLPPVPMPVPEPVADPVPVPSRESGRPAVAFPGRVEPPPLESPVPGELLSLGLTPVPAPVDDELDCAKTAPELPTSKAPAMPYEMIQ
jgi:hypothetical protein